MRGLVLSSSEELLLAEGLHRVCLMPSDWPGYSSSLQSSQCKHFYFTEFRWHHVCRNQLAKGNAEFCAILVAVNSVMQIVMYAPLALFYLKVRIRGLLRRPSTLNRSIEHI